MKHIDVAWIYQELTFDEESEVETFLIELESKNAVYAIDERGRLSFDNQKAIQQKQLP